MRCFNPYFVRNVAPAVLPLPMPCGQCLYCRQQTALTWKVRCELEAEAHNGVFAFVTLTYDTPHLPLNNSVSPAHLQAYLKRLRKSLEYPIRYFACGEYGERRGRPHYHLIIFGLQKKDFQKVKDAWPYANLKKYSRAIDVQKGDYESLGYVAGYVGEKLPVKEYAEGKNPPFHRCSQGLGLKTYLKRLVDFQTFTPYIIDQKKKWRYVGRYLRNKGAEFFNILQEVKDSGVLQMETNLYKIYERVYPRREQALKLYFPHYANPAAVARISLVSELSAMLKYYFEGFRSQFVAQYKEFKRQRQRLDL